MANITSYDGLISRAAAGYCFTQPLWGEVQTATATAQGGNNTTMQRCGDTVALPSLPSGVTSYILSQMSFTSSSAALEYMVAKVVNLGTLNLSSGFSAGSVMPTVTELGVSRQVAGPVWFEVTTALNSAPGSFTITYTNQSGSGSLTTTGQALTASSPIRSTGWVVLNSGDTGVESISSAAQSGGTTPTGVLTFWGVIGLTMINIPSGLAGVTFVEDFINSAFCPYRFSAGDTIKIFSTATTTRANMGDYCFIGDS